MISFKQILSESKKQYSFRIKLACECSTENLAALKASLSKYDLAAISEVKETPIAETHTEFPSFKNIKLSIFDVLTNYPATSIQIREVVRESFRLPEDHIIVRTPGEEANIAPVVKQEALGKDYPKSDKPNLLADLAKTLKDHKSIEYPYADKTAEKLQAKTTNDLPAGTASPVGTHQNKIPDPKAKRK